MNLNSHQIPGLNIKSFFFLFFFFFKSTLPLALLLKLLFATWAAIVCLHYI